MASYPGLQCEAIIIGQVAKKDTLNDAVHIHCIQLATYSKVFTMYM